MESQKSILLNALKRDWYSSYEMQQLCKSSSADRTMRTIRQNPPEGYKIVQRVKDVEGYNKCFEYKLVEVE